MLTDKIRVILLQYHLPLPLLGNRTRVLLPRLRSVQDAVLNLMWRNHMLGREILGQYPHDHRNGQWGVGNRCFGKWVLLSDDDRKNGHRGSSVVWEGSTAVEAE
jgi:hypothetical protein